MGDVMGEVIRSAVMTAGGKGSAASRWVWRGSWLYR